MFDELRMARITATGALIKLHEGNEAILKRDGVEEVEVTRDSETGELTVTSDAAYVSLVSASKNLPRIAAALKQNEQQRQKLLTSALKLPDGEAFLMQEGVYDGKEDKQYIDPQTLVSTEPEPTIDVPDDTPSATGVTDVTEELAQTTKKKKASAKKKDVDTAVDDDLSDL